MLGYLAFVIWVGGAGAYPGQKLGFFTRLMWPLLLGRSLAEWAHEERGNVE